MIEDPEFHSLSALRVGPWRSSILIICAGEATAMTMGYRQATRLASAIIHRSDEGPREVETGAANGAARIDTFHGFG
jgi:hypothetical protein